jgi:hypothetical protein
LVALRYERAIAKRVVVLALVLVLLSSTAAGTYYFYMQTGNPAPPNENPKPTPEPEVPTSTFNSSQSDSSNATETVTPNPSPIPSNQTFPQTVEDKVSFLKAANATLGNWSTTVNYTPKAWVPNATVKLDVALSYSNELYSAFKPPLIANVAQVSILITAERDFDSKGYQHTPWDDQVSTLLTPAGLPIEGGGSGAVSRYNGYTQTGPVDVIVDVPLANFQALNASLWWSGQTSMNFTLPSNLPPGIYRMRLDFGFKSNTTTRLNFNGQGMGVRPTDLTSVSCAYSPPITASGFDVNGTWVNGSTIQRRGYWVLLWDYNSNGYRGVVAKEDQAHVAISPRTLIHDEIILPKYDSKRSALSYNIEPTFLFDTGNPQRNIPWQYDRGEWSVKIVFPNGTSQNLGTVVFSAKRNYGATTKNISFTAWKPPVYGNYTLQAMGWIEDVWGNRYGGGGNYSFWIAERLTIATATFQGQAYNVGNRYGRDLQFNPPCAANVTIKASLYVNSDPTNVTTIVCTGKATSGGLFTAMQGMKTLTFTAPGEYLATVTATYWDSQGALWVCAMTHAGVVYPLDSPIEAHGKKLTLRNGTLVDRGDRQWEGYMLPNGTYYLDHINFPYNQYDVLLIASDGNGSNKIEPVLTYRFVNSTAAYDSGLQSIGRSNLRIATSNGLSPQMFPEYITDKQYWYGSAPRPGFNSRFVVSTDNIRAPYWPTSPNSFGGEIGASSNGDLPGDIYRFLGGVVVKNKNQAQTLYAGYQANGFILAKGSNANRVIAPGSEDLPSPDGVPARFFLVSVRPGLVYPMGTGFRAVLQIDPVLPCDVRFTLIAPDNRSFVTAGKADSYGYFTGIDVWTLDQAGLWVYTLNATWNGYQGKVPGLPDSGGWIFVLENTTAPGIGMTLNVSSVSTFSPTAGLNVTGRTTGTNVYYAAIIPGAVLEQGVLSVKNGSFMYTFDPQRMAQKIKTYDIVSIINGVPSIGDVVHLTFFSEEEGPNDTVYHSFCRVVLRGTTAVYIKEA